MGKNLENHWKWAIKIWEYSQIMQIQKIVKPINYEFLLPTIEILDIFSLATVLNQIPNELKVTLKSEI